MVRNRIIIHLSLSIILVHIIYFHSCHKNEYIHYFIAYKIIIIVVIIIKKEKKKKHKNNLFNGCRKRGKYHLI